MCDRVQSTRKVYQGTGWLVLGKETSIVRCILSVDSHRISSEMARFACSLSNNSYVVMEGIVSVPGPEKGDDQGLKPADFYSSHKNSWLQRNSHAFSRYG